MAIHFKTKLISHPFRGEVVRQASPAKPPRHADKPFTDGFVFISGHGDGQTIHQAYKLLGYSDTGRIQICLTSYNDGPGTHPSRAHRLILISINPAAPVLRMASGKFGRAQQNPSP
ncbi:hypothetical protein B2D07_03030 [Desulfococcus multivorans]|jgi:hypothetical protein|uniref:Uncharacterized protein n=1 Tax=Desulfococcus multivorans DSM 2059 TaxID=1121405 RepID=S7TZ72_DESML|nr:hypothetical protein B2D07_03030 [Desulfococcus multivorans]EPR42035.1 hypothetical protein dsmv_1762 [Desulfococcus multivorans DSM 2059]SKA09850.1 hypothetical protein SAMN02745446_02754 [Desulfococcus multivorans DSM 2059]